MSWRSFKWDGITGVVGRAWIDSLHFAPACPVLQMHYSEMDPATQKRYFAKLRRKNFAPIPFSSANTLLTLASGATLKSNLLAGSFLEDIFVISIDCLWTIRGATTDQGPIVVGYAHGDLSNQEITDSLDANLLEPDNIIQRERSRRPVRRAGVFPLQNDDEVINNGVPLRTRCKFSVGSGHALVAWARNQGGGALSTGAVVESQGMLWGRWQR